MPQIMKSGSTVWTHGNNIFRYSRTLAMGPAPAPPFFGTPPMTFVNASWGLLVEGRKLYCTNTANSCMTIFDAETFEVLDFISTTEGSFNNPRKVSLDPLGGRIFIANVPSAQISILDYTNPHVRLGVITSTQGLMNQCTQVAVDREGNRLFVANAFGSTVSVLNYTTPTVGAYQITTAQGSFSGPNCIVIDRVNDRIFVGNSSNSTVSILNYTNPQSVAPIIITTAMGGFSTVYDMFVDYPRNRLIVSGNHGISFISLSNPTSGSQNILSNAVLGTGVTALAIWEAGNRLIISNTANSSLISVTNIIT